MGRVRERQKNIKGRKQIQMRKKVGKSRNIVMVLNFRNFSRVPFDLLRLLKLSKVPKTRHGLQGLEAAYLDAKAGTRGATPHATQASAESFELLTLYKWC